VPIAEDAASKLPVLKALTRKFRLAPDVHLQPLAAAAPALATGADLYALAADAWTVALRRTIAGCGDAPIPVRSFHSSSENASNHLQVADAWTVALQRTIASYGDAPISVREVAVLSIVCGQDSH